VVQEEGAKDEKGEDCDDGGDGVGGGEPGKPDGEEVFAKAESPVAERFGDGVDGGASGGFGAVRGEGDSAGEKRGSPAPLGTNGGGCSIGNQGSGGRTDERVEGVPDRIEIGDFVCEKFDEVESNGYAEDDGVRENFEGGWEADDAKPLQQAESGHGGVEVESGGEAGAESEAKYFEGVHGSCVEKV